MSFPLGWLFSVFLFKDTFMLKSMTAFGRSSLISSLGKFIVEIQCVNRKHLEINCVLPREFTRFEVDIRNWIAKKVGRGQVNVKISIIAEKESPVAICPNLPLIKQYKQAWDIIHKELEIQSEESGFMTMLSKEVGIFLSEEKMEDEDEYRQTLKSVVDQALHEVLKMKLQEGSVLQKDISLRIVHLQQWIEQIFVKAPFATQRYRHKLVERLKEILENTTEMDERLLKEAAIYAEKIDITEEITRFKSHLEQFHNLIESEAESVGKTLDFLIQELHREINTVASKSSDLEVSRLVIDCKSELERIREQIQNIE
jgi:uncharacterized protein (TIGR00255 family)